MTSEELEVMVVALNLVAGSNSDLYSEERDLLKQVIETLKAQHAEIEVLKRATEDWRWAEPQHIEPAGDSLIDRLRGIYTVPVNDGAGLLNGKSTFTKQFPVGGINHEAAAEILRLRAIIDGYESGFNTQHNEIERLRAALWQIQLPYMALTGTMPRHVQIAQKAMETGAAFVDDTWITGTGVEPPVGISNRTHEYDP